MMVVFTRLIFLFAILVAVENNSHDHEAFQKNLKDLLRMPLKQLRQSFNGKKDLLTNIIEQTNKKNHGETITKAKLWQMVLSETLNVSRNAEKDRAFYRTLSTTYFKDDMKNDDLVELDYDSMDLQSALQKIYLQYLSKKFNSMSLMELEEYEGAAFYKLLNGFNVTLLDFIVQIGDVMDSDIVRAFSLNRTSAEYMMLTKPLSDILSCYNIKFSSSKSLFHLLKTSIKNVRMRPKEYILEKLAYARSFGLMRNLTSILQNNRYAEKASIELCKSLQMKLFNINILNAFDGVDLSSVASAHGIDTKTLKTEIASSMFNRKIGSSFDFYSRRHALEKYELYNIHGMMPSNESSINRIISSVNWKPSFLNNIQAIKERGLLNLTVLEALALVKNQSTEVYQFLMIISDKNFPKQKANVFKNVMLKNILSDDDILNGVSVIDKIEQFRSRLEKYANLPLQAILRQMYPWQKNDEFFNNKLLELSMKLINIKDEEILRQWFSMDNNTETYMKQTRILDIYNQVRYHIQNQQMFLQLSLRTLSNFDLVKQQPVHSKINAAVEETINNMVKLFTVRDFVRMYKTDINDFETKSFSTVIMEWFGTTAINIKPTAHVATKVMSFNRMTKEAKITQDMTLKQIDDILDRKYGETVKMMFLDMPIISLYQLCDRIQTTYHTFETMLMKCSGLNPQDPDEMFGESKEALSKFAHMSLISKTKLPSPGSGIYLSIRQTVTLQYYYTDSEHALLFQPLSKVLKDGQMVNMKTTLMYLYSNLSRFNVEKETITKMVSSWLGYKSTVLENATITSIMETLNIDNKTVSGMSLYEIISLTDATAESKVRIPSKYFNGKPCFNESLTISTIIKQCKLADSKIINFIGINRGNFILSKFQGFLFRLSAPSMTFSAILSWISFYDRVLVANVEKFSLSYSLRLLKVTDARNLTIPQVFSKIMPSVKSDVVVMNFGIQLNDTLVLHDLVDKNSVLQNVQQLLTFKPTTVVKIRYHNVTDERIKNIYHSQIYYFLRQATNLFLTNFRIRLTEALEMVDIVNNQTVHTVSDLFMKYFGADDEILNVLFNSTVFNKTKVQTMMRLQKLMYPDKLNGVFGFTVYQHIENLRSVQPMFLDMLTRKVSSILTGNGTTGSSIPADVMKQIETFLENNYHDLRLPASTYLQTIKSYNYAPFLHSDFMTALQAVHKGMELYVPLASLRVFWWYYTEKKTVKELFKSTMKYDLSLPALKFGYGLSDDFIQKFGDATLPGLRSLMVKNKVTIKWMGKSENCEGTGITNCASLGIMYYSWNDLIAFFNGNMLNIDYTNTMKVYRTIPLSSFFSSIIGSDVRTSSIYLRNFMKHYFNFESASLNMLHLRMKDLSWYFDTIPFVFETLTPVNLQSDALVGSSYRYLGLLYPVDKYLSKQLPLIDALRTRWPYTNKWDLYTKVKTAVISLKSVDLSPFKSIMTTISMADLENPQKFPSGFVVPGMTIVDLVIKLLNDKNSFLQKPLSEIMKMAVVDPKAIKLPAFVDRFMGSFSADVADPFNIKGDFFDIYNKHTVDELSNCFMIKPNDTLCGVFNKINQYISDTEKYVAEKVKGADKFLLIRRFYKRYQWSWKKSAGSLKFCTVFNDIVKNKTNVLVKEFSDSNRFKVNDLLQASEKIKFGKEEIQNLLIAKASQFYITEHILLEKLRTAFHQSFQSVALDDVVVDLQKEEIDWKDMTFLQLYARAANASAKTIKVLLSMSGQPKYLLMAMESIPMRELGSVTSSMPKGTLLSHLTRIQLAYNKLQHMAIHSSLVYVASALNDTSEGTRKPSGLSMSLRTSLETLKSSIQLNISNKALSKWLSLNIPENIDSSLRDIYLQKFAKYINEDSFGMLSLNDMMNTSLLKGEVSEIKINLKKMVIQRMNYSMNMFPFRIFMKVNNNFVNKEHLSFRKNLDGLRGNFPGFSFKSLGIRNLASILWVSDRFTLKQLHQMDTVSNELTLTKNLEMIQKKFGSKFQKMFYDLPYQSVVDNCRRIEKINHLRDLTTNCAGIAMGDINNADMLGYSIYASVYIGSRVYSIESLKKIVNNTLPNGLSLFNTLSIREIVTTVLGSTPTPAKEFGRLYLPFQKLLDLSNVNHFSIPRSTLFDLFSPHGRMPNNFVENFVQWIGAPIDDFEMFKTSLYKVIGKAGITYKEFLAMTPVQFADVLKALNKDNDVLSKFQYVANKCEYKPMLDSFTVDNTTTLKEFQADCKLESKYLPLIYGPLPSDLGIQTATTILKLKDEPRTIDFFDLANNIYAATKHIKTMLNGKTLLELSASANVTKEAVLNSTFETIPFTLLQLPFSSVEKHLRFDRKLFNISNTLREFASEYFNKDNVNRILLFKLNELFAPPDAGMSPFKNNVNSIQTKDLKEVAAILRVNGKDMTRITIEDIYQNLFNLNSTEVASIYDVKQDEMTKFTSNVTFKEALNIYSRLQRYGRRDTLWSTVNTILKSQYFDRVLVALLKVKDVNNRADTVADILSNVTREDEEKLKHFIQSFYGLPFDQSAFLDSVLKVNLGKIATAMGKKISEIREYSIIEIIDVHEKSWLSKEILIEPLMVIFDAFDMPFSKMSEMSILNITKIVLGKYGVSIYDFFESKSFNISLPTVANAMMMPLKSVSLSGTPALYNSTLLPQLLSLSELVSVLTGSIKMENLTSSYIQRINFLINSQAFERTLKMFGMKYEDVLFKSVLFFQKDVILYPADKIKTLSQFRIVATLKHIAMYNSDKNLRKISFQKILEMMSDPFIQGLSTIDYPFFLQQLKFDDMVSLLHRLLPNTDKLTIYQRIKQSLEKVHGKLDEMSETVFFKSIAATRMVKYFEHDHGQFLSYGTRKPFFDLAETLFAESISSSHRLIEKLSYMFKKSEVNSLNGEATVQYPGEVLDRTLFDVIETYAMISRKTLQRRFKFSDSLMGMEKNLTLRTLQSCKTNFEERNMPPTFRSLLGSLMDLGNPMNGTLSKKREELVEKYDDLLGNLKKVKAKDNLEYCQKFNELVNSSWPEIKMKEYGNKFKSNIEAFGLNEAVVKAWHISYLTSSFHFGVIKESTASVVAQTLKSMTLSNPRLVKMSVDRVIEDMKNISLIRRNFTSGLDKYKMPFIYDLIGIKREMASVLEDVPIKYIDNKSTSLFDVFQRVLSYKLDDMGNKPMLSFASQNKSHWLSVILQNPYQIIGRRNNIHPDVVKSWFYGYQGKCRGNSLLYSYAVCWRTAKEDTKKNFVKLSIKAMTKSQRNIFDVSFEDLAATKMFKNLEILSFAENLLDVYSKSDLTGLLGMADLKLFERSTLKSLMNLSKQPFVMKKSLRENFQTMQPGKLVLDVVFKMPLVTLLSFCKGKANESVQEFFKACTGHNIYDLLQGEVVTSRSLFHIREKSLVDISNSLNIPIENLTLFNIKNVATLDYFGNNSRFLLKSYFEIMQEMTKNPQLLQQNDLEEKKIILSWFGLRKFEIGSIMTLMKYPHIISQIPNLAFHEIIAIVSMYENEEDRLFLKFKIVRMLCGPNMPDKSGTLRDFFVNCKVPIGNYASLFKDATFLLNAPLIVIPNIPNYEELDLFSILDFLQRVSNYPDQPLRYFQKSRSLPSNTTIKDTMDVIGYNSSFASMFGVTMLNTTLKEVANKFGFPRKNFDFLTMKDVLSLMLVDHQSDGWSQASNKFKERVLQASKKQRILSHSNLQNFSVGNIIEHTFGMNIVYIAETYEISLAEANVLKKTSLSKALEMVTKILNVEPEDVTIQQMVTHFLFTFDSKLTELALSSPIDTAKNLSMPLNNITALFMKSGLSKDDITALVLTISIERLPKYLKSSFSNRIKMTDLLEEVMRFNYMDYKKKLGYDYQPTSLINLIDDIMYQTTLEKILATPPDYLIGNSSTLLAEMIKPAGSNRGIQEVLKPHFHIKIISKILNKTYDDYKTLFKQNQAKLLKFEDVIKDLALNFELENEYGIIGNGMLSYMNYTSAVKSTVDQIFEFNYNLRFLQRLWYLRSMPQSFNENQWRNLKLTDAVGIDGSEKPQSSLLFSWREVIQDKAGLLTVANKKKILKERRLKFEEIPVLDIYQNFMKKKMKEVDFDLSRKIMHASEEFFGESSTNLKIRWDISDVEYDRLKTASFADLKWMFQFAVTSSLTKSKIKQFIDTGKVGFYLQPFKLYRDNVPLVDAIFQSRTKNESMETVAMVTDDVSRNYQKGAIHLLTKKNVNTFFQNMSRHHERVIDVIADVVTDEKNKCSSYCKSVSSNLECTTESNATDLCKCKKGFEKKLNNNLRPAICVNLNECLTVKCGVNEDCIDTMGFYHCRCMRGYAKQNGTNCTDINECNKNICDPLATCNNTIGGFQCECPEGKSGNGRQCQDACAATVCPEDSKCVNVEEGGLCVCKKFGASPLCDCRESTFFNNRTQSCEKVKNMLKVKGLKLDQKFDKQMANRDTRAFKRVSKLIKRVFLPILKAKLPGAVGLEITAIREGSVEVDFIVLFDQKPNATAATNIQDTIKQANSSGQLDGLKIISTPVVEDTDPCKLGTANCVENSVCVADTNEAKNYRCDCDGEWDDGECIKNASVKRFLSIGLPILISAIAVVVVIFAAYRRRKRGKCNKDADSSRQYTNPTYGMQ